MGSESHIDTEVAGFLADVRATYVSEPEEAVASRHLAAIAREVELVRPPRRPPAGWRRTMNRSRRPALRLAAATAAAVLGTAGLAFAGVNLPDPAQKAFERAGITLPNQAGGGQSGEHSRSDEVHPVLEATPPSERGCAFGHSVAEAAKGSALPDKAQDACDHASENAKAEGQSESSSHSEFGRETSERAKGQKDATVDERKSFGQETSTRARENGGAPDGNAGADHRADTPAGGGTTGAPEGMPSGPPEGTPDGPPDTAPVPDGTPNGPPAGTPSGP